MEENSHCEQYVQIRPIWQNNARVLGLFLASLFPAGIFPLFSQTLNQTKPKQTKPN